MHITYSPFSYFLSYYLLWLVVCVYIAVLCLLRLFTKILTFHSTTVCIQGIIPSTRSYYITSLSHVLHVMY